MTVRGDTHIICEAKQCTFNFADRLGVFAIPHGANLTFHNFIMNNFLSTQSQQAKQLPIKPTALNAWPSILVEDGVTVWLSRGRCNVPRSHRTTRLASSTVP